MAMGNSADIARKWAQNLGASTSSIKAGVLATTTNPAQKAAQRADAYVSGVQQAVASGKWQRGLARTSLQSWQDAMVNKGLPRIASGASAATPKVQQFYDKWIPHQQALQAKLASMPRGDLSTNIQRAVVAIEHNASFKYQ